ncbi:Eco29kI family restriction endonuclease [Candidatus Bipolaricaulota bacterium]
MKNPFDVEQFMGKVENLIEYMNDAEDPPVLSPQRYRAVKKEVLPALEKLEDVLRRMDPVRRPERILDPSDPRVVGRLIALAMLAQPRTGLDDLERFYGSGVYALYYEGTLEAYAPISGTDHPVYVGKASPKDVGATTIEEQGEKLFERLRKHRQSIREAKNLESSDFTYRALVVKSAWQSTAEEYLIRTFTPIWNKETKICFGFGKHGDSSDTRANTRSPWDTLHPGRPWTLTAATVENTKSPGDIQKEILAHFGRLGSIVEVDTLWKETLKQI